MNNKVFLLKWAGGKNQLLERYKPIFPKKFNNYYEPFIGGGAVFYNLNELKLIKNNSYLSDLNKELINVYDCVKNNPYNLIQELNLLKSKTSETDYYELRKKYNQRETLNLSNLEIAALFLYLNKTGYNGLYRVNKKNVYNVPWNKKTKVSFPDNDIILEWNKILSNVSLNTCDFRTILKNCKKNDFVYLDPPYTFPKEKESFTSYTPLNFSFQDQVDLAFQVKELDKKGVFVMISNHETDDLMNVYKNLNLKTMNIHSFIARRSINSNASKRTGQKEIVICNF